MVRNINTINITLAAGIALIFKANLTFCLLNAIQIFGKSYLFKKSLSGILKSSFWNFIFIK